MKRNVPRMHDAGSLAAVVVVACVEVPVVEAVDDFGFPCFESESS